MQTTNSHSTITPPITRIDLEATDDGVFRRMWSEGWTEGSAADVDDFLPGRNLLALLFQAERRGWSVTQFNEGEARLLRGEITRVDFQQTISGLTVSHYPYGWTARTRPLKMETIYTSLEEALRPYTVATGWITRQWAEGARAWKGAMLPVRDSYAILSMRRRYSERPQELARLSGGHIRIDFAFDL